MSDASHSHEEEAHEGPVKTPKQLVVTIFFSFVIPIFVCVMLATYVTTDPRPAAGSRAGGGAQIRRTRLPARPFPTPMSNTINAAGTWVPRLREQVARVVVGQQYLVDRLLIGLLANGHVLLEGVVYSRGRVWVATQPGEALWLESAGGGLRVASADTWLAAMTPEAAARLKKPAA